MRWWQRLTRHPRVRTHSLKLCEKTSFCRSLWGKCNLFTCTKNTSDDLYQLDLTKKLQMLCCHGWLFFHFHRSTVASVKTQDISTEIDVVSHQIRTRIKAEFPCDKMSFIALKGQILLRCTLWKRGCDESVEKKTLCDICTLTQRSHVRKMDSPNQQNQSPPAILQREGTPPWYWHAACLLWLIPQLSLCPRV